MRKIDGLQLPQNDVEHCEGINSLSRLNRAGRGGLLMTPLPKLCSIHGFGAEKKMRPVLPQDTGRQLAEPCTSTTALKTCFNEGGARSNLFWPRDPCRWHDCRGSVVEVSPNGSHPMHGRSLRCPCACVAMTRIMVQFQRSRGPANQRSHLSSFWNQLPNTDKSTTKRCCVANTCPRA